MASTSPMERTLAIPELLTLIITHLHDTNKLKAQCVCKSWQDALTSNVSLQKQLHLEASTTSLDDDGTPSYSDLLIKTFLPFFQSLPPSWIHTAQTRSSWTDMPWTRADPSVIAAFTDSQASWRRALVRQPPPAKLEILEHVSAMGGTSIRKSYMLFTEEKPLTMGVLYDLVEPFLFRDDNSWGFSVTWPCTGYDAAGAGRELSESEKWLAEEDCVKLTLLYTISCMPDSSNHETKYRSGGFVEPVYDVKGQLEDDSDDPDL